MPTRGRPPAGPVARAAPRPQMHAGSRVAEIDDATDRVLQGRSWRYPFQPFAARSSDVPAGGAPDGRTTLLPLTRRISMRGSVGNNVDGRFHGQKMIPRPSRACRLGAGPPGRLSREPEPSDTWHAGHRGPRRSRCRACIRLRGGGPCLRLRQAVPANCSSGNKAFPSATGSRTTGYGAGTYAKTNDDFVCDRANDFNWCNDWRSNPTSWNRCRRGIRTPRRRSSPPRSARRGTVPCSSSSRANRRSGDLPAARPSGRRAHGGAASAGPSRAAARPAA